MCSAQRSIKVGVEDILVEVVQYNGDREEARRAVTQSTRLSGRTSSFHINRFNSDRSCYDEFQGGRKKTGDPQGKEAHIGTTTRARIDSIVPQATYAFRLIQIPMANNDHVIQAQVSDPCHRLASPSLVSLVHQPSHSVARCL